MSSFFRVLSSFWVFFLSNHGKTLDGTQFANKQTKESTRKREREKTERATKNILQRRKLHFKYLAAINFVRTNCQYTHFILAVVRFVFVRFVAFAIPFITLLFTQICRHWNSNELPFSAKQRQIELALLKLSFPLHFKWNAFLSWRWCCHRRRRCYCNWNGIFMSFEEKKESFSVFFLGMIFVVCEMVGAFFSSLLLCNLHQFIDLLSSIEAGKKQHPLKPNQVNPMFWSSVYGKMSSKSIPISACVFEPKSSWISSLDAF